MAAAIPGQKTKLQVGVGCLILRSDRLLFVRSRRGYWSPPGGKLEMGESLKACAIREIAEETGLSIRNVEFVALTNDIFAETERHDLTIWMRAEADDTPAQIQDPTEITDLDWFPLDAPPTPLHLDIQNLLAGRCLPPRPANCPFPTSAP